MLVGETELRVSHCPRSCLLDFRFSPFLKTRCGTRPFCAPEILLGLDREKGYSLNVDSWSVGNIVYYMYVCLTSQTDVHSKSSVSLLVLRFVLHGAYNPECWTLDKKGNVVDPDIDWESLGNSNASPQGRHFSWSWAKTNDTMTFQPSSSSNVC